MKNSFVLSGVINADSGMIKLLPVGNRTDYPKSIHFSDITVEHGKFVIRGKISFPIEVFLLFNSGNRSYISGDFFVEPGTQTVSCNADSLRKIPDIHTETMQEYVQIYLSAEFQSLDTMDDYHKRINLRYIYVFKYAQKHPESYVALWQISRYLRDGYNKFLDSAFTVLAPEIKTSETGRFIKSDLDKLLLIDTGKIFPNIHVMDLNGGSLKLSYDKTKAKYILVDFWYSHCGPCLGQLPIYRKILEKYHDGSFAIIGISSDSSASEIEAWKKVIHSQSLSWIQYRTDGKTMEDLRITFAPYNFLLDGEGKIIAKDLTTKELADFLQTRLN